MQDREGFAFGSIEICFYTGLSTDMTIDDINIYKYKRTFAHWPDKVYSEIASLLSFHNNRTNTWGINMFSLLFTYVVY